MEIGRSTEQTREAPYVPQPPQVFEQPPYATIDAIGAEITMPPAGYIQPTISASETAPPSPVMNAAEIPPSTDIPHEIDMVDAEHAGTWRLSPDTLDSIRLEASMLPPGKQAEIDAVAGACTQFYTERYGQFMNPAIAAIAADPRRKVIVASPEMFSRLDSVWEGEDDNTENVYGILIEKGGFCLVKDPNSFWLGALPGEMRADLIRQNGGLANALAASYNTTLYTTIAHESAHSFEGSVLPIPVSECGARYYTQQADNVIGEVWINDVDKACHDFYTSLIAEFGDDVHRLYFGTLDDTARRDEIMSRFSPEKVHELFPGELGDAYIPDPGEQGA